MEEEEEDDYIDMAEEEEEEDYIDMGGGEEEEEEEEEEDYISMDISRPSISSFAPPLPSKDFEFQTPPPTAPQRQPISSPADELFYRGNLLPLLLPPRLLMLQSLLQTSPKSLLDAPFLLPSSINPSPPSSSSTPFTSCHVSQELNPEHIFFDCPTQSKKPWAKKLWFMKKLRASKAYFKSLFSKSTCSQDSCAVLKAKDCSNGRKKKNPEMAAAGWSHRRSFSDAIKRRNPPPHSSSSSSSSSSSFSSSNGLQVLKRSSSANSDVESSIQVAIAYCKKTQQCDWGTRNLNDVRFVSLSPEG
ncbi:putative membrane-associated kinase regulator 4 [Apostasia shenzhenica]|uniref:Putative membrane-associated kinase regulator 4 n=1 Tax=Apostasia shenzhenica TaxID=1088818 RepID=A0A2I0B666_9ASPA|nr:putative membrane-associated kinase regulator 4 [Apostasia shenzhenica]